MTPRTLPVLLFETLRAWGRWLEAQHATAPGVWLRLAKKAAALESVWYAEALDEAMCHGWMDMGRGLRLAEPRHGPGRPRRDEGEADRGVRGDVGARGDDPRVRGAMVASAVVGVVERKSF